MMSRFRWLLPIAALLALVTAGAQEATVSPVASVKQLHDALITPTSDVLFGAESSMPKDTAAWGAVRNSALLLAESGNLLMLQGRARDAGDWMKLSRGLVDAAAAAMKAADARNIEALIEANGRIVAICENCHEPYRDGGKGMMMRR